MGSSDQFDSPLFNFNISQDADLDDMYEGLGGNLDLECDMIKYDLL